MKTERVENENILCVPFRSSKKWSTLLHLFYLIRGEGDRSIRRGSTHRLLSPVSFAAHDVYRVCLPRECVSAVDVLYFLDRKKRIERA